MPALNFMKQFADAVESGEKRQTIRAYRKDGLDPKVGDTLYLYTGMRTKQCRKLGEVKCKSVEPIYLSWEGCDFTIHQERWATNDGFDSFTHMLDWFEKTHGLPFEGLIIKWGEG